MFQCGNRGVRMEAAALIEASWSEQGRNSCNPSTAPFCERGRVCLDRTEPFSLGTMEETRLLGPDRIPNARKSSPH